MFPKGFLWGTAISAHQVEGNNIHSDWWHWEKSNPNLPKSGIACDHYHKYKKDFKLARDFLHNNSIRISIEWARIEPSEGKFDKKQINHYVKVLRELKKMKLTTLVTLHHFTNPEWFANKKAWSDRKNLKYFERYVDLCATQFGEFVDYWIAINEPNTFVAAAYMQGIWPPQEKSIITAVRSYANLAKAHNLAYKIIHKHKRNARVSSAVQMTAFNSVGFISDQLSKFEKLINNFSFYELTKKSHDFMGINYYGNHVPKITDFFKLKKTIQEILKNEPGKERTDMGWPIYPPGIGQVINEAWKKYKLPVIITENGIADKKDSKRANFIVTHLSNIYKSMEDGVNVIGYIHWTLMDNFEWDSGRRPKFGLFETDYKTLRRIPRKSAFVYSEICRSGSLPVNPPENYYI